MMERIDFGGAVLALLAGFLVSAGLTGFILSAGGYHLPMAAGAGMMTGPGAAAAAPAPAAPAQAAAKAAPAGQVAGEVKVVATDLKFTPATLQAKVGQALKVVLENKGVIEHDIAFLTIKADKPAETLKTLAKAGQTTSLEFTPTAKGSYEFICTIPGHKEAGMKGTINVVD